MQFYKWCLFLMRMVSPRMVGLILYLFIGTPIFIIPSSYAEEIILSNNSQEQKNLSITQEITSQDIHKRENLDQHRLEKTARKKPETPETFDIESLSSVTFVNRDSEVLYPIVNSHLRKSTKLGNSLDKSQLEYLLKTLGLVFKLDFKKDVESIDEILDLFNIFLSFIVKDDLIKANSTNSSKNSLKKQTNNETDYEFSGATDLPVDLVTVFKKAIENNLNTASSNSVLKKTSTNNNENNTLSLFSHSNFKKSANASFVNLFPGRPNRRSRHFDVESENYSNDSDRTRVLLPQTSKKRNETKMISKHKGDNIINSTYPSIILGKGSVNIYGSSEEKISTRERDYFVDPFTIPYKNFAPSEFQLHSRNLTIYEILKPRLRTSKKLEYENMFSNFKSRVDVTAASNTYVTPKVKNNAVSFYKTSSLPAEDYNNITGQNYTSDVYAAVRASEISDSNFTYDNPLENSTEISNISVTTESSFDTEVNNNYSKAYIGYDDSRKINVASTTNTPTENSAQSYDALYTEDYGTRVVNESISTTDVNNLTQKFTGLKGVEESELENITGEGSEAAPQTSVPDPIRQAKMSATINSDNSPFKNPKLDPKVFYDYFAKKSTSNSTAFEFPYPEFRPGHLFRHSDNYERRPVIDVAYTSASPIFEIFKPKLRPTTEMAITSTTFDSVRTSVRVSSTFYPNRIQDVTMIFGNRGEYPTTAPSQKPQNRNDEDPDEDEYRDALDPGFTMEKLAYLLIGTCCGLSILCLCVVVVAIKCRRVVVERRLKTQFRKRMYQHERMKDPSSPWQQQMFDHMMYLRRPPGDSSCSSAATDCNCRCVTWSLGPRNLESSNSSGRPLCGPNNRNSLYLCGQKKLPFGAASTLRYESMLGRPKRPPPAPQKNNHPAPNTDSSPENDSLDQDSQDSREGNVVQCTCIDYNVWPLTPDDVRRGVYGLYPSSAGRYNIGECIQHPAMEMRTIARDIPPPVTGSNYLDRSEGVVYWSSNDERLI